MEPGGQPGALQGQKMGLGAAFARGWPWEVKIRLLPMMESTFRTGQSSKNSKMLGIPDFFALGHGVQRGGCEALLVAPLAYL